METQTNAAAEQIITQVINSWAAQNKAVTAFFNKYDDNVYLKELAPGRNRAIYLLGHLVAVSDAMLPLLGLGEKQFPQLEAIFIKAADKSIADIPSLAALKQYWETVNTTLTGHFNKMNVADWLDRHTSVSKEDFVREPLRNKLNVLLSRTNHASYHIGQLNFLSA
jgi:hypothetical protein